MAYSLSPVCGLAEKLLFNHIPQKQRIPDQIPPPHSFGFFSQSIQPFQRMLLPPYRSALTSACKEIEHRTDSTHMTVNIQFVPVLIRPLLLFRSSHSNPQEVGISFVYCLYYSLIVLFRELWFIRRRICYDLNVWKAFFTNLGLGKRTSRTED